MIGGSDGEATTVYRVDQRRGEPAALQPRRQRPVPDHARRSRSGARSWSASTTRTPRSAAYPSQTDVNLAAYPDAVYVIVSLQDAENPELRGFWIRDGEIEEAELDVV